MNDLKNIALVFLVAWIVATVFLRKDDVPAPVKPIEITSPARVDTVPVPVYIVKKVADSTAIRTLLRQNDSLRALLGDTIFVQEYFAPYNITVDDSLTENYLTITPMEVEEERILLDSTYYKPFTLTGTVAITEDDCKAYIPAWYEHYETQLAIGLLLILTIAK
jgi:hypothetical protein